MNTRTQIYCWDHDKPQYSRNYYTKLMETREKWTKQHKQKSWIKDKSFVQLIKDFDMGVTLGEAKK